jgi:transcriptional regulator with XRE-family HTH domain
MSEDLTRRLMAERARLGLTQGELAARIGVSQGAVSRWEKGRHRPSFETLSKLAVMVDGTAANLRRAPPPLSGGVRPGRTRLRFRRIEEPRRRLTDLLEDAVNCAMARGNDEIADSLRLILERCAALDQGHPNGRRAFDRPT